MGFLRAMCPQLEQRTENHDTVTALRNDLRQIPNIELCLAVKANRCQSVLGHMAKLGLGADITTIQELIV